MFWRPKVNSPRARTKAEKRIARLPTTSLLAYAETTMTETGLALNEVRKHPDHASHEVFAMAAHVLSAIANEMLARDI